MRASGLRLARQSSLGAMLALIVALLACSLASVGVKAAPTETGTRNMGTQLTAATFKDTLKSGMWFVEFYSPYCHHCRDFAPTWGTLVEMHGHLADSHDFHFGRVDCVAQGDLCADNGVRGYPTMRIFEEGKFTHEFKGERSYERVSEFILSNAKDYRTSRALRMDRRDEQ